MDDYEGTHQSGGVHHQQKLLQAGQQSVHDCKVNHHWNCGGGLSSHGVEAFEQNCQSGATGKGKDTIHLLIAIMGPNVTCPTRKRVFT